MQKHLAKDGPKHRTRSQVNSSKLFKLTRKKLIFRGQVQECKIKE